MPAASISSSFDKTPNPHTVREHHESADPLRHPFELDRHRIITCTAFRRLQNKTQVFAPSLHDHFRNRLTHSLEVAQIARCLARNCGAEQDLCEAISLAHDLGHAPFSHAGEKALNELMTGRGGFNHNAHSVRVVEFLEHPYPAFRGLNMTCATLEGLRSHATRYDEPSSTSLLTPSIESQIASIADRIAYNLHDLEDAIGAGLIDEDQLSHVAIWGDALAETGPSFRSQELHAVRRPLLDAILNRLIADALANLPPVLKFSNECEMALQGLETFLLDRVYHHSDVDRADAEGQQKIHELFSAYMRNPDLLPARFAERIPDQGPHRVICDFIAGMSDPYCSTQYSQHCNNQP